MSAFRPLIAAAALAAAAVPAGAAEIRLQQVVSPGGITAWLAQDDTVPIVSIELAFTGGAIEPADKAGLRFLAADLLDEGAGDRDWQAFQALQERFAIRLEAAPSRDHFLIGMTAPKPFLDTGLALLRDAVTAPRFDPDAIERVRAQNIAAVNRRLERAGTVGFRAMMDKMYGDHPYAVPTRGTPEGLANVTRDDLVGFVDGRFAKDNLIVAAVGDIAPDALAAALDATFGTLRDTAAPAPTPALAPAAEASVTVIRRPLPQSRAYLALPGLTRTDPDWWALRVMNQVFGGGGMTNRLFTEVREKRGLAYGADSGLLADQAGGLIYITVGTANARMAESLSVIRTELTRLAEGDISDAEIADAKTYLKGAFPLTLDSSRSIANILLQMRLYNLGRDYLERRDGLIDAVTAEDVRRVAARLVDLDRLHVVVVGDPVGVAGDVAPQEG